MTDSRSKKTKPLVDEIINAYKKDLQEQGETYPESLDKFSAQLKKLKQDKAADNKHATDPAKPSRYTSLCKAFFWTRVNREIDKDPEIGLDVAFYRAADSLIMTSDSPLDAEDWVEEAIIRETPKTEKENALLSKIKKRGLINLIGSASQPEEFSLALNAYLTPRFFYNIYTSGGRYFRRLELNSLQKNDKFKEFINKKEYRDYARAFLQRAMQLGPDTPLADRVKEEFDEYCQNIFLPEKLTELSRMEGTDALDAKNRQAARDIPLDHPAPSAARPGSSAEIPTAPQPQDDKTIVKSIIDEYARYISSRGSRVPKAPLAEQEAKYLARLKQYKQIDYDDVVLRKKDDTKPGLECSACRTIFWSKVYMELDGNSLESAFDKAMKHFRTLPNVIQNAFDWRISTSEKENAILLRIKRDKLHKLVGGTYKDIIYQAEFTKKLLAYLNPLFFGERQGVLQRHSQLFILLATEPTFLQLIRDILKENKAFVHAFLEKSMHNEFEQNKFEQYKFDQLMKLIYPTPEVKNNPGAPIKEVAPVAVAIAPPAAPTRAVEAAQREQQRREDEAIARSLQRQLDQKAAHEIQRREQRVARLFQERPDDIAAMLAALGYRIVRRARAQRRPGPQLAAPLVHMSAVAQKEGIKQDDLAEFRCPITLSLISGEVIKLNAGNTPSYYDKIELIKSLGIKEEHPLTRAPLKITDLKDMGATESYRQEVRLKVKSVLEKNLQENGINPAEFQKDIVAQVNKICQEFRWPDTPGWEKSVAPKLPAPQR